MHSPDCERILLALGEDVHFLDLIWMTSKAQSILSDYDSTKHTREARS